MRLIIETCGDSMVNIDSDDIRYATIKDMYVTGNGEGLQLNDESMRPEVTKMCRAISDAVFTYTANPRTRRAE